MEAFQKRYHSCAGEVVCGYSLSYRDVEELALERGLKVDHSTIHRWVVEYSPQLEASFRKRYKHATGSSFRMDETYIKVKGQWMYLYRAVDKEGNTIDFMLSETRDKPAASAFFIKAMGSQWHSTNSNLR